MEVKLHSIKFGGLRSSLVKHSLVACGHKILVAFVGQVRSCGSRVQWVGGVEARLSGVDRKGRNWEGLAAAVAGL